MTSLNIGPQAKAPEPYPNPPPAPSGSPSQVQAILGFLTDPAALIPPAQFTSALNALQSVATVTGQLTTIVNAASTSVVLINAIRANTPGFALMLAAGLINNAAVNAGFNPNNIVGEVVNRVNQLIESPIKFLEQAFRAQTHAQASFTGNGFAAVFEALGGIGGLLVAAKNFTDLISGGITANFGPSADNTANGRRLTAAGISVDGPAIRRGIRAVSQAMRDIGTLWDPNEPEWIGTPAGLIKSLVDQGIAERVTGLREALYQEGVFLDDAKVVEYASPFILLLALSKITGRELNIIIDSTGVNLAKPASIKTAADLCQPDNIISQEALDNLPYGNMTQGFGQTIATLALRERTTWETFADTLDQLNLPDVGLVNNPTLASDMSTLRPFLGTGNGLFNDATLTDFIGTAAGAGHTQAFALLNDATLSLGQTGEGQALQVALAFYESRVSFSDPAHPNHAEFVTAETNLIFALEQIKNSPDPVVQEANAQAEQSMLESALQLVGEITNAVATGYAIFSTVASILTFAQATGTAIAATAASLGADGGTAAGVSTNLKDLNLSKFPSGFWAFVSGFKGVLGVVNYIVGAVAEASGITGILEAMANPSTRGGQAILLMIAESKNKIILNKIGIAVPEIDVTDEAKRRGAFRGFGLNLEQQNLITAYGRAQSFSSAQLEQLFFQNSYYGYQRHFFENAAGLFEGYRVRRRRTT